MKWLWAATLAGWVWGCGRAEPGTAPVTTDAGPAPVAPSSAAPVVPAAPAAPALAPLSRQELARLFEELSEPDRYFFSDNYVSNETSYLQPSAALSARARKGGAYIGVGPEQNFSYIALTEPALAFIVDIRRANALEHLLYKVIFERAGSRVEFLSLLTGRASGQPGDAGADASIESVLAEVDRRPKSRESFRRLHDELVAEIRDELGIRLSAADRETLDQTHSAFFEAGLDLSFELHEKNGRKYPKLRELLAQEDASGKPGGFLASDAAYQRVRTLQLANRIIPVVGDFAGDRALVRLGAELTRRKLTVSVFYVSNVEQYLMEPDKWQAWTRNVAALPADEQSLFLRCYLDQGRRHPRQLSGHRTASILSSFDHFKARSRARGYGSFFQLVTDGVLEEPSAQSAKN